MAGVDRKRGRCRASRLRAVKGGAVPPPAIPLSFVGTALLALGTTLLWLLLGNPAPLALLHALVLGVFLMVAMGLLYQFVPVVAMAPLRWPYAAFVHLVLAVVAAVLIVSGFQRSDFALVRLGGLLELCGVLVQAGLLVATLNGRRPPPPALGAAFSLLWLTATIGGGVWLADRLTHGDSPGTIAGDHALAGLAGFFGTLIAAVTLRLLRMFERVDRETHTPVLALSVTAAAAIALGIGRLGGYALAAAAAAIGMNVATIARARNPAYQRETLAYAGVSAAGALTATIAYTLGRPTLAIAIALWYFIGAAIAGYVQRVVPLMWWIQRSRREGPPNIPTLSEMNHTGLGYGALALWTLAGCLYFLNPRLAAGAGLTAWIALVAQLLRPFRLQKGKSAPRS